MEETVSVKTEVKPRQQAPVAPTTAVTQGIGASKQNDSNEPLLEQRYNQLLKMIAEIGRDIKPSYTNSKVHADRLKKNITSTRAVLRECLLELDRLSRLQLQEEQQQKPSGRQF